MGQGCLAGIVNIGECLRSSNSHDGVILALVTMASNIVYEYGEHITRLPLRCHTVIAGYTATAQTLISYASAAGRRRDNVSLVSLVYALSRSRIATIRHDDITLTHGDGIANDIEY